MKKKVVWLPYDMDTGLGINNEGELVFDYRLEDIDKQQSGADVYNGQQSVIWKNIRAAFPNELAAMYQSLRSSGALSYAKVEQMFEEHQGKWPETVFNEDSYFKYIEPLLEDNVNYLGMLLGSKAEQRKWWLYNRFRYIDSKYVAGDALTDYIMIRPYAAQGLSITPYADIYTTVKWDDQTVQKRTQRGTTAVIPCPYQTMNDNVVWIYSASQLASIGDISGLQVGLCDISMATRLQELKIGDASAGYENANLRSLTLGNNVLLKTIDARNCSGLGDTSIQGHTQTSVNLSGCTILENAYFGGTKINGLTLPNGGVLKVLSLPKTLTSLIVLNQSKITTFEIEDSDYSNITTLRIENCSSAVPVLEILSDLQAKSRVRIIGLQMGVSTTEEVEAFYDKLDTMTGLDENGDNLDKAVVSGTITGLGTITGEWLAQMYERYPNITIEAQTVTSVLTFKSWDGETTIGTATYENGVIASGQTIPTVPARANSADGHYTYTGIGWDYEMDSQIADASCLQNVLANRTVYAAYQWNVRSYTVTWKNGSTTLETDTNVPWGTVPTYNGATPTQDGKAAIGWDPEVGAITGNTTYSARYTPKYTVRFYSGTTLLDTVSVYEGSSATYTGATLEKTGVANPEDYIFTSWSPQPTNITKDTDCYAQFRYTGNVSTLLIEGNLSGEYANSRITSVGMYALAENTLITGLSLPNVTIMGDYAIRQCKGMLYADMPELVTVGSYTFDSCTKLESINIPKAETIGNNAFYYCDTLTRMNLPAVKTIGSNVFSCCYNIEEHVFGDGLTKIGDYAFYRNEKLTQLIFGPNVTQIGAYVANGCNVLERVEIRSVPTKIHAQAFFNTPSLTDIYVPWAEGEVADAPWDAENATIHYGTVFPNNAEGGVG